MKWSIPSFNIFPPRATPWAFENWFVQIPVPWTKIVSKSPKCWIWWSIILQKARTATVTFYTFTSNRFDYSSFKTQTLQKFTSEPSARQRELFFFKHLHAKDKTRIFLWNDMTLPVQIPYLTKARFKFSSPLRTDESQMLVSCQREGRDFEPLNWSTDKLLKNLWCSVGELYCKMILFNQPNWCL